MLKKLRVQFVAVIMVIVTAMLCLVFGMIYHFTEENLENESIRMMQSIAADPFQRSQPDELSGNLRLPYFILQIGIQGDILATGGGYYDLSDADFLNTLIEVAFDAQEQTGIIKEYHLRFYRMVSPLGQTLVFADITSERIALQNLVKNCALIGSLCLLLFLGVSIFLAVWMVKPVDKAWKQQRQFVADASHELKTPLTVMMTNAELLQNPDYDESSRAQFSGNILTMARQMRVLVERLLDLARADNEQSGIPFAPFDFSAMTEKALLPFEPIFFEKELELSSQIQGGITISGSEQHLHQVLDILLDNAQKYAVAPSCVQVRLEGVNKHLCRLSVSNRGDSLSSEELQNIFKRFYRVDKARSRDGSFGLGLSIAESIVKAHHGRIWAESRDGILTFFVELPVKR